jgi:hypothetical protein
MRAGARADDQEEGVLNLPVQPDDPGQAAEDLALAPFLDGSGFAAPPPAPSKRAGLVG